MQRIFLPAVIFAVFSITLSSCCTPCKERAAKRKAAAESAYGAGTPGKLPEPILNPALDSERVQDRDPAQY